MEDRVRIYELARQMSLSNQEVITLARECGIDIKSHSSTINRNEVGLLIAHMGKKKQQQEQPKSSAKAGSGKTPAKATSKAPSSQNALSTPSVKPRVIGRYRPTPATPEGTPPLEALPTPPTLEELQIPEKASIAPNNSGAASTIEQGNSTKSETNALKEVALEEIPKTAEIEQVKVTSKSQTIETTPKSKDTALDEQKAIPQINKQVLVDKKNESTISDLQPTEIVELKKSEEKSKHQTIKEVQEQTVEIKNSTQIEEKNPSNLTNTNLVEEKLGDEILTKTKGQTVESKKKESSKEAKEKVKEEYSDSENNQHQKDIFLLEENNIENIHSSQSQAIRPMSPSVPSAPSQPIRIAAPSFRATPPRPPKHRPGPTDRHGGPKREEKAKPSAVVVEIPQTIALTSALTVKDLAGKMAVTETEIIKRLMVKGYMRTINQLVELELARELAVEMGYELQSLADIQIAEAIKVEEEKEEERKANDELSADEKAALLPRPPVVTIMGHVDHGKTSLLDAIRQTKFLLTDAEAGGITQHIGAYHVEVPGEDGQTRQIVFLDTPGHEAFTAMRARGARCTDIAILVVAADDGVMPQTVEAIDHAKAAGVPIVVAVNKIDKAGSDPDRVLSQLMEHGLLPDRFGGDTVTVNVSAKKRTGLDDLLEMILLVADMQDLKANPDKNATGIIVEAELHRGKGAVATALVQNGTLRLGDIIVAGSVFGRVRALLDDRGHPVRAAGPSMPVEVLGLPEVPQAGDKFEIFEDLQTAKQVAEQRKYKDSERRTGRITLESLHELVEQGEVKDLNIIVKADVLGTAEAIADQIRKLSTKEVNVRVLRAATGDISENDVNLATSSTGIIIGFNVQPDNNATRAAESAGVDIRTYNIIYEIIDNLELAIQGLLQPIKQEVAIGTAEVRQVFKMGKSQIIAGCMVTNGKVQRGAIARVMRGNNLLYEGKIDTLRRFKDDVKEVAQGFECGLSFDKFNDLTEGDQIHAFVIQEIKREIVR